MPETDVTHILVTAIAKIKTVAMVVRMATVAMNAIEGAGGGLASMADAAPDAFAQDGDDEALRDAPEEDDGRGIPLLEALVEARGGLVTLVVDDTVDDWMVVRGTEDRADVRETEDVGDSDGGSAVGNVVEVCDCDPCTVATCEALEESD